MFLVSNLNLFIMRRVNAIASFSLCKVMAAKTDSKQQSFLIVGGDFLQQTSTIKDWVFYKKSRPPAWLSVFIGHHTFMHVKRLR